MIVLDTNVISEAFRVRPNEVVRLWLDARNPRELFLCAPVLAELRSGIERLPEGRRRDEVERFVDRAERELFGSRVIPLDRDSAYAYGHIVAQRQRMGRPIGSMDGLIAAIALTHRLTIATRDTADFADLGIEVVNPFEASVAP